MSGYHPIYTRYYYLCNNIDLSTYDDELIDAMKFSKYGNIMLGMYLDNKKILMDSETYKKLIDLYLYVNFDECCDCDSNELYQHFICCECLAKFIIIIINTGYKITLIDILHFPFVSFVIYRVFSNVWKSENKSHKDILEIRKIIYGMIVDVENECATNRIKEMIKIGSEELLYLSELLKTHTDDEIKLYGRLVTIECIHKETLVDVYRGIKLKPNKAHAIFILDNLNKPYLREIKNVIDFFNKHEICVSEREIKLLNRKYSTGCFSKNSNSVDKIISYSKTKESYDLYRHEYNCYSGSEDESDSDE